MAPAKTRSSDFDFDLFVLGAGSGGVRASRISASYGARVAVAESGPLGGTCVNVGCVPKKLFVYASHVREDLEDARGYGFTLPEVTFDWPTLLRNKNAEIERLNGIYRRLLSDAGVELFEDRARILGPHQVAVGERTFSAHNILVAVGGKPSVPNIPGIEHALVSDAAFFLDELPARALIVGGGYIAVEFAGIWNGLGVDVTQLYRGELFLRGFDDDVRMALAEEMRAKGVDLRFGQNVREISKRDGSLIATLESGEAIETDLVFYATGREANTDDLGLETTAVERDIRGRIAVDDVMRTQEPNIFAIGDCAARPWDLTPVAIHEGMAVAATLFDDRPTQPDYDAIATAVFSQPAIGTCGLTEHDARLRFGEIDVYRSRFRTLKHTLTENTERTLMKIVVDRSTQRVLGVHVLGPDAAEIVQGFAVAIKMGATKQQFDATIGIHPTSAEELVTMRTVVSE